MTEVISSRRVFLKALALGHLRNKRRIWTKSENDKWFSMEFDEKEWLSQIPEGMRIEVIQKTKQLFPVRK